MDGGILEDGEVRPISGVLDGVLQLDSMLRENGKPPEVDTSLVDSIRATYDWRKARETEIFRIQRDFESAVDFSYNEGILTKEERDKLTSLIYSDRGPIPIAIRNLRAAREYAGDSLHS